MVASFIKALKQRRCRIPKKFISPRHEVWSYSGFKIFRTVILNSFLQRIQNFCTLQYKVLPKFLKGVFSVKLYHPTRSGSRNEVLVLVGYSSPPEEPFQEGFVVYV